MRLQSDKTGQHPPYFRVQSVPADRWHRRDTETNRTEVSQQLYSEVNVRVTAGPSDGEFKDGSRVEEVVGRPIRSDFRFIVIGEIRLRGFGSFSPPSWTVIHVLSRCHFLKQHFVDERVWDTTVGLAFLGCLLQNTWHQTTGPSSRWTLRSAHFHGYPTLSASPFSTQVTVTVRCPFAK